MGTWPSANGSSELWLGPSSLGDAPLWVLGSHSSCLHRGSVGSGGCGPSCQQGGDQKIMTVRIEFVFSTSPFCQWFWLCGSILQSLLTSHLWAGSGSAPRPPQSPVPPVCPAPLLMRVLPLVPCVTPRLAILLGLVSAACHVLFVCLSSATWLDLASASFLGYGVPHCSCNLCPQ